MLRWCAKHGITHNKVEIWKRWQFENRLVEAVKKRMLSEPGSRTWDDYSNFSTPRLKDSAQKTLPFGTRLG